MSMPERVDRERENGGEVKLTPKQESELYWMKRERDPRWKGEIASAWWKPYPREKGQPCG